jgi:hypothetical protein
MDAFATPGVGIANLVAGTAAGVAALEVAKAGIASFDKGGVTGHIPQAANGLVTRGGGGMMAAIHSNEAILPLEKLAPMMSEAMGKAMAKNGGGNGGGNIQFIIQPPHGDSGSQEFWDGVFREKITPAMQKWDRLRGVRT